MSGTFFEYCDGYRIEVEIPKQFSYKEGNVNDGYVIENDEGDQYIRIPAGYTSDGMYVRGFWISRYEISMLKQEAIPRSIPKQIPLVYVNFNMAVELAKMVGGVLPDKEDYNRICMWLVETRAATFEEVFVDGSGRGNYTEPFVLACTAGVPNQMVNRLDNFFGNCYIWTTEKSELYDYHRVIRGGHGLSYKTGKNYPPSQRAWANPEEGRSDLTFRIVMRDSKE